ncbi:unnamed protein product [Lathyrus oleraceus]
MNLLILEKKCKRVLFLIVGVGRRTYSPNFLRFQKELIK